MEGMSVGPMKPWVVTHPPKNHLVEDGPICGRYYQRMLQERIGSVVTRLHQHTKSTFIHPSAFHPPSNQSINVDSGGNGRVGSGQAAINTTHRVDCAKELNHTAPHRTAQPSTSQHQTTTRASAPIAEPEPRLRRVHSLLAVLNESHFQPQDLPSTHIFARPFVWC
mmetsp:Transcript_8749/g.14358  ORF Transcript_8749/g.14358 Transcript_8749/m.14358 type:complete len:166 (-) Transcript_8749:4088-4585(-)